MGEHQLIFLDYTDLRRYAGFFALNKMNDNELIHSFPVFLPAL